MCENCHCRAFFEEDPVVAVTSVTSLTYYFVVEMVDMQTIVCFRRALCTMRKAQYVNENLSLHCAHNTACT
jgi:hypothetical protein